MRRVIAALALLLLAATGPLVAQGAAPLPSDTALHTGQLANGLRYWVRHNGLPEKRLELRLVVRAGSILEDQDQRGLAHFVEHMSFNGTTHFAKNDLIKYLESIGVRFGADLNAETSFDETTYILPVPSDKPELVSRAFDILQDWAAGDRFDSANVVSERGVILGEWRSGLGAGSRVRDQEFPFLFQGSRYANRLPIGDTGIVAHANPAPIKRFYHDWYRPDLMGIIAVGDYPVDSLIALIKSRFGALKNPASERPRTETAVPDIPGTRVAIITDSELTSTSIQLLVRRPAEHYRTEADERRTLITGLYSIIGHQRFQELERHPDVPFLGASFGPTALVRNVGVFSFSVSAKDGMGAAAFEAGLRELRRLDEHGVLPAELERAKADLLRSRQQAAAEQNHTESEFFVDDYIGAFVDGDVPVSAPTELALAQRMLPTITIAEVNSAIQEVSRGTGRSIVVTAPAKVGEHLPPRDTLLAILARTDTATLAPWTETTVDGPLVASPPAPGRIVAETTYTDVGVTQWQLSNGIRVLIKPTDFKADQIYIAGDGPGGFSLASDTDLLNAELATTLVRVGGVGAFDAQALTKRLAGTVAQAGASVDETSQGLFAEASPKDLATAFQLLWLNAMEPRYDSTAIAAFRLAVRSNLVNRGLAPATALQDTVSATMSQHSPRALPLTVERFDAIDSRRAMAIYRDWFSDFSHDVFVVVGAVSLDSLRPLVTQWLGALPSTGTHTAWRNVEPLPPDGAITKIVHKGKEPVVQQVVAYSGVPSTTGPEEQVAAAAVAEILQQRLLDRLRQAMGATYSVTVNARIGSIPRASYTTAIQFQSTPAQSDTLWQAAQPLIDSLRTVGPTADELQKFVAQTRRELEVAVKTNEWWMSELSNYAAPDGEEHGRPLGDILFWDKRLDALTPAMVRDAARRYLDPARVARFILLPETTP
ncbi:MAG TPA: insulinase family protein [Gemmatimonadales bacterium]|jgi:zinc protease|nr:insulinase family protein [Gemmatimonadales bacterium]